MMEFKIRLLVDSQDPEYAYAALRDVLQESDIGVGVGIGRGVSIKIQDNWMRNNEPLPADCAQKIALQWQRNRPVHSGIQFQTNDPAVMAELNQMDLFTDQEYLVEGHVGFVPVTGEGQ